MQMVLVMDADKIKRYNLTTQLDEEDRLLVPIADKQWLVTPNAAALLALRHSKQHSSAEGWELDAYALEESLEQPYFHQIAEGKALAPEMAALPAEVCLSCTVCNATAAQQCFVLTTICAWRSCNARVALLHVLSNLT